MKDVMVDLESMGVGNIHALIQISVLTSILNCLGIKNI